MSVSCLIRARASGNWLCHLSKQNYFSSANTSRSSSSLLAQSAAYKPTLCSANYATTATTTSTASDNASTNWTTIYRLPLIRLAAGFQRLKIYQGTLTTLAVPAAFGLSQAEHVSPDSVLVISAIGVSGLLTLSLCSLVVRNVIGFIYINEERDKVKFAYVDFWGKRCETVIDIADLDVDWTKVRPTVFNIYQKIRLYGNKAQSFKLLSNYGVIVEPDIFTAIFGE
ncbi:transmembrane protein 186 [Anastrepha ludens]|uniref:transmembrane protein 186 n=1 Tax=Anastrepha ludens TaxID=28586 RepID=UPI0023B04918|nr:transmembrane protein 186 [Anastrepha ludens]